ncbi:Putative peptidoglycan binding domain-containing protein [Lysobacter sp. yr284]|uniref:peptidoglycan-binding domain-containing protein n=1 Tax=Lysobacter sp. yr284 TaxID=1761791 RepID=UPI00089B24ED|nr:peptidoglycan-binding domain-containing protein [Lysobacter sp. yr284]SDY95518.1 Putative peptidoglycan binding domain-containing protein [Lysobacter sp. yr284]
MGREAPRHYQVTQYNFDEAGERNTAVAAYDDLVTHHPLANFGARMVDGGLRGVERPERRSHAFIDGAFQEVEMLRTDEYRSLKPDQVLLIKDFILEDRPDSSSTATRAVDVPSPVAGYVSRRDDRNGLVEISDRKDGEVIARVRHLGPIAVDADSFVAYGQSLGTQNALGLPRGAGKHVHVEMDTRYRPQLEGYVNDLASGRLPVQAQWRQGVQSQPAADDGTMRLGQSSERIGDLQRAMAAEGYRSSGGRPLDQDGVYRLGMQGALLDFQRDHGVAQTGNIDPATLRMAPPQAERPADRQDHFEPHRPMPAARPEAPTAPGHPGHPDHRPGLSDPLPEPVNRHALRAPATEESQPLAELSPADRLLFDRIRSEAPTHVSDDVVASAMLAGKQAGIDSADKVGLVAVTGERLCVGGTTPGFHAMVDTTKPAPQLQETVQQAQALDHQRMARDQEREALFVQNSPGRSI